MRKLFRDFFGKKQKREERIVQDQKQEFLIRLGREQFQKLLDKGLTIPVMTL